MELSQQMAGPPPTGCLQPSCQDRTVSRPSKPATAVGAFISTLRGMSNCPAASGLGRIGGFGAPMEARRWSDLVLLSNSHVLNAHGAGVGDTVFQPAVAMGRDEVRFDSQRMNPIAVLADPGHEGPYRFAYPGEEAREYFIDCATARLLDACASPSGTAAFTAAARAHPLDVLSNRTLTVRLAGVHDRPAGRVTSVRATVECSGGRLCPNCIVIDTLPGRAPFAGEGDSGGLVVDHFGRAVGLLWGIHLERPRIAYACHIHPVLDRLRLTLSRRVSIADHVVGGT